MASSNQTGGAKGSRQLPRREAVVTSYSQKPEYYGILGLPRTATSLQIRKKYTKLALIHHPDKNGNTPESNTITQRLNEAYQILTNQVTRGKYDQHLKYNPKAYGNSEYFQDYPNAVPTQTAGCDAGPKVEESVDVMYGAKPKERGIKHPDNKFQPKGREKKGYKVPFVDELEQNARFFSQMKLKKKVAQYQADLATTISRHPEANTCQEVSTYEPSINIKPWKPYEGYLCERDKYNLEWRDDKWYNKANPEDICYSGFQYNPNDDEEPEVDEYEEENLESTKTFYRKAYAEFEDYEDDFVIDVKGSKEKKSLFKHRKAAVEERRRDKEAYNNGTWEKIFVSLMEYKCRYDKIMEARYDRKVQNTIVFEAQVRRIEAPQPVKKTPLALPPIKKNEGFENAQAREATRARARLMLEEPVSKAGDVWGDENPFQGS